MKMDELDSGIHHILRSEEMQGERRVNKVRLAILVLFLVFFLFFYLKSERHYTAGYIILFDLLALLAYALAIRQILAKDRYHSIIRYISSAADITCITTVAIAAMFLSSGHQLRGWVTIIAVFPLFIAISGLRLSPSLAIFTGCLTSFEFVLLNLLLAAVGEEPLPVPQLATIAILLMAVGGVIALIALRARQLIVRASLAERQQAQLASEVSYARLLAETDDLTSLYNRRYFMAAIRQQHDLYVASQRPYALLIIDLDYFKKINDTFGHPGGDHVIREVASVLRSNSRATDILARFGGDEFGVILTSSDPKSALMTAERLCGAVREHPFWAEGYSSPFHVSLSIGLACCPGDATEVESLLRAADNAVYQAKASGRDCVVFGES